MSNPSFGKFCWNELSTSNVKAAQEFYGKIFGWEFVELDLGNGMLYTKIKSGEDEFGGMWQIPSDQKDQIQPHWMAYITVDNLEKTLKQAEDLGATVKMPITKAGDYGRFAIIADPTGAPIAFWECVSR